MKEQGNWNWYHTVGLAGLIVLIFGVGLGLVGENIVRKWVFTMLSMLAFVLVAGDGITGRPGGAFIDERKKISLSRLQLLLWTVLILSAYFAAALSNIEVAVAMSGEGLSSALGVAIPKEIWVLLGISAASFVGSPIIKSTKRDKDTTKTAGAEGQLVCNAELKDARWSDMFTGEETGNSKVLDLGKVQMFFFTLIVLLVYGYALRFALTAEPPITEFPAVDQSMLALLGISHTAYLSYKAAPHTRQTP